MRKKTESSLPTFSDKQLAPLHEKLLAFTGQPSSWKEESERSRVRAFQVRSNARLFKYWYLRSQVLKRFQGKVEGVGSRREAAIDTFFALEAQAGIVNQRLADGWGRPWPEAIRRQLRAAQRLIAGVLGPLRLDTLPEQCGFSSGATTDLTRDGSSAEIKWEEATHVTKDALPYAIAFVRWAGFDQPLTWLDEATGTFYSAPRGRLPKFEVVDGNKVFTVPKRFDTDRTCAKEPSWNVFLQKGVGTFIRKRLQTIGLLLPTAQEQHARMSQQASKVGDLATVDMKGASELVTQALVELLLPPDVCKVILDLRSPRGFVPGRGSITYEKISSMGNGNTFELETLIFWALARACCSEGEVVSVYGDDLICPTVRIDAITRLFRFVGFEFNQEKSFTEGPFRESCGGHFWRGVDVKPFYVEQMPRTMLQLINLHNEIIRWMDDWPVTRLVDICREIRRLIPKKFWGPIGVVGSLWSEWDEARPTYVRGRADRPKQPAYSHWRVSTVRREAIVQRHDYFRGSLFECYWQNQKALPLSRSNQPWWNDRRLTLAKLASLLRERERAAVSTADFTYVTSREVRGWAPVGVASDWPRLPVRLA